MSYPREPSVDDIEHHRGLRYQMHPGMTAGEEIGFAS
jgi:hypothetical protein